MEAGATKNTYTFYRALAIKGIRFLAHAKGRSAAQQSRRAARLGIRANEL
jgi:hypothetical protein